MHVRRRRGVLWLVELRRPARLAYGSSRRGGAENISARAEAAARKRWEAGRHVRWRPVPGAGQGPRRQVREVLVADWRGGAKAGSRVERRAIHRVHVHRAWWRVAGAGRRPGRALTGRGRRRVPRAALCAVPVPPLIVLVSAALAAGRRRLGCCPVAVGSIARRRDRRSRRGDAAACWLLLGMRTNIQGRHTANQMLQRPNLRLAGPRRLDRGGHGRTATGDGSRQGFEFRASVRTRAERRFRDAMRPSACVTGQLPPCPAAAPRPVAPRGKLDDSVLESDPQERLGSQGGEARAGGSASHCGAEALRCQLLYATKPRERAFF